MKKLPPNLEIASPAHSVVRVDDSGDAFSLNLKALELASERVKEACTGDDMQAAAIEAHFGLHAVYDLHEAYFRPRGIRKVTEQDEIYATTHGEVVGGLILARGARTHHLVTFARTGGFGDHPYGMGPYGPGWIWKRYAHPDTAFEKRSAWYQARVAHRLLWTPLDEAWVWFLEHEPRECP